MESIVLNVAVSVVTAFLTYLAIENLKKAGKITVYVTKSRFELLKPDEYGQEVQTTLVNEATRMHLSVGLDLHSSSEIPKSLHRLSIELKPRRGRPFSVLPMIPHITSSGFNFPQKLQIINLPPREIIHIEFECWEKPYSKEDFEDDLEVSLVARYPNGRKFKTRLFTAYPSEL